MRQLQPALRGVAALHAEGVRCSSQRQRAWIDKKNYVALKRDLGSLKMRMVPGPKYQFKRAALFWSAATCRRFRMARGLNPCVFRRLNLGENAATSRRTP